MNTNGCSHKYLSIAFSALFGYLCYGPKAIINILIYCYSAGIDLRVKHTKYNVIVRATSSVGFSNTRLDH